MPRTVEIRSEEPQATGLPEVPTLNRDTFWNANETLRKIRDAADARLVGRWALLGSCLVRVATNVPTDTVLPNIVGSYASLNYFVAIAAGSSGGKSAAQAVARELLPITDIPSAPLGTGQGLVAQYVTRIGAKQGRKPKGDDEGTDPVPEHLERTETSILFTVDEIGDIESKVSGGGNNLMPAIRSAWGAEAQGSSTVTKENRLRLTAHSYRMGLIINTQLGAARFLLDDSDVGTPQRFLFVPAVDASELTEEDILAMTSEELAPAGEVIREINLDHLGYVPLDHDDLDGPDVFFPVQVCQEAKDEVRQDRYRARAGLPTRYPPHHLLNRLKTASLLHFLCGGDGSVTEEYWELAGILMNVSEETKAMLREHADATESEENTKKGEMLAQIEDAKQDKLREVEDKKVAAARERILSTLADGSSKTRREINNLFGGRNRKYGMTALTALEADLTVSHADGTYFLAE